MTRLEELRLEAGRRMGLGDVTQLVIPKPVLVAPARNGGTITGRYFMPHACHNAFAITGAVAMGTAGVTPGTVIADIAGNPTVPVDFVIEHPTGSIQVRLENRDGETAPVAYLVRTARRLFEGKVLVRTPN
jgi:2-methylaconitate cis-trans-isomerase PrpF